MSPVSNTSARQGTGEESNLRNVAPETNAQAMSPWALVTVPKRRFLAQKRSHRDVTTALFRAEKRAKGLEKRGRLHGFGLSEPSPPKSEIRPRFTPKSFCIIEGYFPSIHW